MLTLAILLSFVLGIGLGYLFRSRKRLLKTFSKMTEFAIGVLLFILGSMVGSNPAVMNNLTSLVTSAVMITIGAVLGSIIAVYPLNRLFFRDIK